MAGMRQSKLKLVGILWGAALSGWFASGDLWSQQSDGRLPKAQENAAGTPYAAVLDEVAALVEEHFYDPGLDLEAWRERVTAARQRLRGVENEDQFDDVMAELLATLKASHTHYYSRLNPKRYQLLGIFQAMYEADRHDLFVYPGIGIDTREVNGQIWIRAVYDGLPAARAGLRFGDQLISVDGKPFHPIRSFENRVGEQVRVELLRQEKPLVLTVEVAALDGRTMFETALAESCQVIQWKGRRLGYVHAWSYAGEKYHNQIREAVRFGKLSDCEGLVLDIRDGWGGASLEYLNLFRPPIASMLSTRRNGEQLSFPTGWDKPLVLLTNRGSTSGKEALAYGFKKLKLGTVVGETTAGAVLAGRAFLLGNGAVLYLAVMDVEVDGKRLEGVGVRPDVEVLRPHDQPTDAPLEAALDLLGQDPG